MMRKSRLSKPYKCGLIFHWSDHSQIKNPAQGRVLLFGRTTQIDHNAAAYRVETLRAPSLCSGV